MEFRNLKALSDLSVLLGLDLMFFLEGGRKNRKKRAHDQGQFDYQGRF